ncbi:GH92 family glycosyl hydrolase [uncultured Dokdonia sp.]|uniref:GH92 family glycosyl hydrolase n=1 Tax=uncultured Dokdonia sp. TaxID=575653 RepID=UPI002623396E|nr:GH92 family glycosyl hydrolase [uncultured Dokdonia sp.]
MRFKILLLLLISICFSCKKDTVSVATADQSLTSYVNTFIGTGGHGHTYPGATMPFGMMQLSPDTRLEGWDGCSGYHYDDTYIYGFSHTHLSGTGILDYGDILLMPTTSVNFHNGADGQPGYRAPFSHDKEKASPGYYEVHLDSTNIDVALTVTQRAGMHKYAFAKADNQYIILDIEHRDILLDGSINILSDTEISGHRFSESWAKEQKLYYYIKFSKPIANDGTLFYSYIEEGTGAHSNSKPIKGPITKAALKFDNPNNEPIYVSVGISAVDEAGAKKNLETEIGSKTFEQIKQEAKDTWEKQLSKIVIEDAHLDNKTNFYSALYHTMIAPNIYQDVDGRYRGIDQKIHETTDFEYYTVFSLWDTYRAAHPLYTIIEENRTNDFINTFLAKYNEGGILPIWDLSANYTGCMIGYHGVPVIADAYMKGIRGYDTDKAFEAMLHSATRDHLGLEAYKEFGYIPVEEESESVSKTLEYAYDDWTIAQMAKSKGDMDTYNTFIERAQYYKNTFDPSSKFMRGRVRNTWFSPFDPFEVNFNYTEANAWQYSFYVPQDITGFTKLIGGKKVLETQLDELFTAASQTSGRDQADITGLIGQYAHGNEPSHHMAYLYNFINKPYKTQEKVREILTTLYTNEPDGVSGNEDCGQMSAWYVLSSMGFYSVTPGSSQYIIGAPLFDKASIYLENGNTFTVQATNLSDENIYIASAKLNGTSYPYSYITHEDITKGGSLVFEMSAQPSNWATDDAHIPSTEIKESLIVPVPFIAKGDIAFKKQTEIVLGTGEEETTIYYSASEGDFLKYEGPITITEPTTLYTYSEKEGQKSVTIKTEFYKIDENLSIQLDAEYANAYNAGGNDALIDGIRGTANFRTGTWQGYHDRDVIATVDLGKNQDITSIETNFLEDQGSWIFFPTEVELLVSSDGKNFKPYKSQKIATPTPTDKVAIKTIKGEGKRSNIRYVKLIAKTLGPVPTWHKGHPYKGRSWVFVDEIAIQ